MLERWNTHFSTTVEQELFGIDFQLAQDPNSSNLGTTVWDASIVLAKYIEKNSRRGDFSRPKIRGKRALELGAGMGLAGMALALLGADVTFTDIGDVLPLLRRNVEQNISPAALKLRDAGWAASEVGRSAVASLDWSDRSCYAQFEPRPYDFILAADCVYSELAVPHLLATVLAMGGPRTQTIVTNEFRSQTVHDEFMAQFGRHFTIRKVQTGKMDPNYQHPLIHIYLLKRRKEPLQDGEAAAAEATTAAEAEGEAEGEAAAEAIAAAGLAGGAAAAEVAAAAAAPAAQATTAAVQGSSSGSPGEAAAVAAAAAAGGCTSDAAPAGWQGAAEGQQGSAQPSGSQGEADEEAGEQTDEQLQAGTSGGGSGIPSSRATQYEEQFQTRRQGAMLARLLRDVKLEGGGQA